MEKRTLLAIVLSLLVLVIYQWLFVPKPNVKPPASEPAPRVTQTQQQTVKQNIKSFFTSGQENPNINTIHVNTPFYKAELTTDNLAIVHWYLKDYKETLKPDSPPVDLIGNIKGIAYPMWESYDGSSFTVPSSINYTCDKSEITISDTHSKHTLICTFNAGAILFKKIITFYGNSYTATVTIEATNLSNKPITERLGLNWSGLSGERGSRYDIADGILLINNSRDTIEAKSLNLSKSYYGNIEWFGMESRYFVEAVIPQESSPSHLYATRTETTQNGLIPLLLTYIYNPITINPSASSSITYAVFLGPKNMDVLKAAGFSLARTLYFGWADVIAKPIFYVLRFINKFVHNYGWSIVILTIIIRIILFPLGQIGFKSMRQMQKIAPKLNELKEKYKNDKERLYRETTNLYRTYKINPLGGCLPILLQIPIFIALYEVLLSSIELRQAPFIWWIKDLAIPDSIGTISLLGFSIGIHILPLIMGVTMFFQQWLTPTTADQAQAKMLLWIMPILLTVLFWGFPSGLVLYWTVNNIFSIGQQYYILKKY
jgi:YidC/Oxa1 family membrane protein insertase